MNESKACINCGVSFVTNRPNQKYCSDECSKSFYNKKYDEEYESTFNPESRNCLECGRSYIPLSANQKYCSKECSSSFHKRDLSEKYESTFNREPRNCLECGRSYIPLSANQKYCSNDCRDSYNKKNLEKYKRNWDQSPRNCIECGKSFVPSGPNHKCCSKECRYKKQRDEYKQEFKQNPRICQECGKSFIRISPNQKLCMTCKTGSPVRQIIKKANFVNFGELRLFNEHDFEEWFVNNYVLFGIKRLLKINRMFPDVVAETYDGKVLRIELEFSAVNFRLHGHDPSGCDLIISYISHYDKNNISGVPVISIFNAKFSQATNDYNPETFQLTDYFQEMVESCKIMLNKFLHTNIAYDSKKQEAYQNSRGHAYLHDEKME